MRPEDGPGLHAVLDRCSDRTIYLRFFVLDRDAAARYVDELTGPPRTGRCALVAEVGNAVVGVAGYEQVSADRADVAVLVDDEHQRHGVGWQLLEGLAVQARRHGIHEFVAMVLSENGPMLHLLTELPYPVTTTMNGTEREARWSLHTRRGAPRAAGTDVSGGTGLWALPDGSPAGNAGTMSTRTDPLITGPVRTPSARRIVVGVDDEGTNVGALRWAAHEARARGAQVRLERGYTWAMAEGHMTADDRYIVADLHREAERAAQTAAAELRAQLPGLVFDVDVQQRNPVDLILDHGPDVELIVLGSGHHGVVARVLFGSVSSAVAGRADVPVVVVGDPAPAPEDPGDVVVGVKPDESSRAVLRFGFEYAARHGRAIRAVLCGHARGLRTEHRGEAEQHHWLSGALAEWCAQYPQVPVTPVFRSDDAAPTLVAESMDAALLVVGRSGRAHHALGTLGAVSQAVVHHATRPVAVIPVPPAPPA